MSEMVWHGLDLVLHPEVYAPAEDTELLLDALEALSLPEGAWACDVGTGTGALALALARRGARVLAVDVSADAVRLARANALANGLAHRIDVVRGDALEATRGPFDVVSFNPPYLPVEGETQRPLARAWEGGEGGIGWAPRFLEGLQVSLAPRGVALVVLSTLGKPGRFRATAAVRGFTAETVGREKLPWEELEVVALRRRVAFS